MRSFLALIALTAVASADPKPQPKPAPAADAQQMVTDDCAKAQKAHKQCRIDMSGETVEGTGGHGDGTDASARTFERLGKLMHPRRDFIAEIVQSAENLD
jgi:hypothetical protein